MNFLKKIHITGEQAILSGCLFLGAIFVFQNIGLLDFWLDEAAVYIVIKHSFWEMGTLTIQSAQQFLHNYGLKVWALFFGYSPVAMRSFSAFCYLLLILMMYKAGTYFFRDKKVGLLAAFMLTTNYFAIYYAMEVKVYTLAALLSLLSFYFFIKSMREPNRKNYFLYFTFSVLGVYVHPWLILTFGTQIFSVLLFRKYFQKVWSIVFTQLLISLTSIPFIFLTLNQGKLGVNSYAGKVDFWVIFQSFSYLSFGATWAYLGLTLIALFFALKEKAFLKNIFEKLLAGYFPKIEHEKRIAPTEKQKEERMINIILIFYLMLPMIIAAAYSHFKPAYVAGRYEMVVLPAILLLLANLWLKIREKFWVFLIIIILLFFAFQNILTYRESIENYKSTDRTVIGDVYAAAKNGDYVIATDLSWATSYYYSGFIKSDKKINLVAYPEQMVKQIVWINSEEINNPQNRNRYEQEADSLIEKIKNDSSASQIFVLYKDDGAIYKMLREKLDQNFEFIREEYPEIPREPSWYSYVIVYKKR